jgi:hypothetical protein
VDAVLCVLQIFDYVGSSPLLRKNTYIMLTSDNGETRVTQPPRWLIIQCVISVGCMPQQHLLRLAQCSVACLFPVLLVVGCLPAAKQGLLACRQLVVVVSGVTYHSDSEICMLVLQLALYF